MGLLSKNRKMRLINYWPPFWAAGIKVLRFSTEEDLTYQVALRMKWFNRNLFGTHYGGSLFSMCDPWYVFLLLQGLGKGYIVWDKAATIRFKKPGTHTVKATFTVSPEEVERIRAEVDEAGKQDYTFTTVVTNQAGEVVAEVDKVVNVRRKDYQRS